MKRFHHYMDVFWDEIVIFLYGFSYVYSGQTGGGLQYARTYSAQCFGGHQQIGSDVRQRSSFDDLRLIFHELVVTFARRFKPPGISLYL